jgi:malate permease and related proteins
MNQLQIVLAAVLPVFAIVLAGLALRRANWLTEEADESLLRLTVNILAPCLILDSILKNAALKQPSNVLLPPLIGLALCTAGMVVALLLARFCGVRDPVSARTFGLCAGLQNYGYVPLPLVMALFDRDTLGVLFVHNLGVDTAMWTIGLIMIQGPGKKGGWRKLISAPVLAIVIGILLNFAGLYSHMPQFLLDTFRLLGQCANPLGLILIGATMADQLRGFHSRQGWGVMTGACVVRLGLLPLLFLAVAKFLPCSLELKRVLVVQAAMPSAVFPIVMAKHYGGDQGTAVRVVAATSLVSLITIPLWLKLGLEWIKVP